MVDGNQMINEIKRRFPDFEIYQEADGLPVVISSFFVKYLITNFNKRNTTVIKEIVRFVNELAESENGMVQASFDEIVLGTFDAPNFDYNDLRILVSPKARDRMDTNISLWIAGNRK